MQLSIEACQRLAGIMGGFHFWNKRATFISCQTLEPRALTKQRKKDTRSSPLTKLDDAMTQESGPGSGEGMAHNAAAVDSGDDELKYVTEGRGGCSVFGRWSL